MKNRMQIFTRPEASLNVDLNMRVVRNMEAPETQPFLLSLWICTLAPLAVLALPNSNLTDNMYKKDVMLRTKKENNSNRK